MHIVVATHGHCFDGLCSAAMFTRLLQRIEPGPLDFSYLACGYGIGQKGAPPEVLQGDQNAILDYRFTASDRLSWYFDHHRTAFANEQDRAYFEGRVPSGRFFFDAGYSSCTKLIADVSRTRFGVEPDGLDELLSWADRIDSASFADAAEACDPNNPVLQLVRVVEHHGSGTFIKRFVPDLLTKPLLEVASSKEVLRSYQPIGEHQAHFTDAVRRHARQDGRVVVVDLLDQRLEVLGKFVTYALFPTAVYSVIAARLKRGFKIAVGYNPWCGQALDVDISAICARYGGGGHQAVGGISLPEDELDDARATVAEIGRALASGQTN